MKINIKSGREAPFCTGVRFIFGMDNRGSIPRGGGIFSYSFLTISLISHLASGCKIKILITINNKYFRNVFIWWDRQMKGCNMCP